MKPRHKWVKTESQWNGQEVQRCGTCETERTRDPETKSLFLYRRGKSVRTGRGPIKRPMADDWRAFIAGVYPECIAKEE